MSAYSSGQEGLAAIDKKNWPEAIDLLSKGIADTKAPAWLLGRALAYQQTGQVDLALRDVEQAYHAATERGNHKSRKHMIDAQYRRAVLLFRKGQFADADCCAVWSEQLAEGLPVGVPDTVAVNVDEDGDYKATLKEAQAQKWSADGALQKDMELMMQTRGKDRVGFKMEWNRASMFRAQCLGAMENLPKGDNGRKVTVAREPPKWEDEEVEEVVKEVEKEDTPKPAVAEQVKKVNAPQKMRTQFYQSDRSMTVSLFIKIQDSEKANVHVDFFPNLVALSGLPREPAYAYIVLNGPIRPADSTFRVSGMKIELTLAKEQPGKWTTWGSEEWTDPRDDGASQSAPAPAEPLPAPGTQPATTTTLPDEGSAKTAQSAFTATPAAGSSAAGPSYPTSSKSGPKNWDKIVENDDDKDEDEDVNFFFKQLYKTATPEQQRAMAKSFTESNGTSLSTDWNDVKGRKVETIPPDGVEAKKWDN